MDKIDNQAKKIFPFFQTKEFKKTKEKIVNQLVSKCSIIINIDYEIVDYESNINSINHLLNTIKTPYIFDIIKKDYSKQFSKYIQELLKSNKKSKLYIQLINNDFVEIIGKKIIYKNYDLFYLLIKPINPFDINTDDNQNSMLMQLFEFMPTALRLIDLDYNVIATNKKYRKFSSDYGLRSKCYSVLNSSFCGSLRCPIKQAKDTKKSDYEINEIIKVNHHNDEKYFMFNTLEIKNEINSTYAVLESFYDITNRYKDEIELRKLSEITKHNPLGIVFVDKKGQINYSNFKFSEITGYTKKELLGKNPSILKSGYHNKNFYKKLWEKLLERKTWSGRILNKKKDGTLYWSKSTIAPIYSQYNELLNYVAIQEDITHQVWIEEQLKIQEHKYRDIYQNAPIGIFTSTIEGQLIETNQTFADMLDYKTPDELVNYVNKSSIEENLYFDGDKRKIILENVLNSNKWFIIENKIYKKDKTIITTLLKIRTKRGQDNKKVYLEGFVEDITLQKQYEERLRKNQKGLKEAQKIANIGSFEINTITGDILASEMFYKILEISNPKLFKLRNLLELMPINTQKEFLKNYKKIAQKLDLDIEFKNKSIKKHIASKIIFVRADNQNTITEIYGTIQDITYRKETEIKLLELNATKDKFFSIIAHDLKNPFNTLLGFSQLLINNLKRKDFSKIDLYANKINKSTKQAYDLLENLLKWSRSQRGVIKFSEEIIYLTPLVKNIVSLLHLQANNKEIELEYDIHEDINVYADINMIDLIIRNLVTNAIKFTNKKGIVKIIAKKRESDVLVTIRDNGIGMNKEKLDKLFKINEIGIVTSDTDGKRGSGLGLILCKEFIEKNQGKIWAESEPNKGSRFYFTLKKGEE